MCEHAVIRGKCCWAVLSVLKMSPSFLVTEAADRCRLMNSYMLFSYTAWWLKTDRNNQKSVIVLSCKGEFGLKLQLYHLNKQQKQQQQRWSCWSSGLEDISMESLIHVSFAQQLELLALKYLKRSLIPIRTRTEFPKLKQFQARLVLILHIWSCMHCSTIVCGK